MRLIVGLGNPGPQYEGTRHNAGFWFVDLLARRHDGVFRSEPRFHAQTCRIRVGGQACWLLKPITFMNRSGQSVSSLARYFRIPPEEILVAHDELDLPAGTVRLKKGGGPAGHNGLRDIISALGSREFWRLRIGIDRPADSRQVVDYVLGRPSRADDEAIDDAIDQGEGVVPEILAGEFQRAMNRLHVRGQRTEDRGQG